MILTVKHILKAFIFVLIKIMPSSNAYIHMFPQHKHLFNNNKESLIKVQLFGSGLRE